MTTRISDVSIDVRAEGVMIGAVLGRGCTVGPAPAELDGALQGAMAEVSEDASVKKAVRDLLRFGKYKPTGRGKPACEYLAKAAREQRFPRINNLVDINNLISLETQLPISLVDVARAETDAFAVRRGREGERYVFNASGQEIDLQDLLLVARLPDDVPCANPVKDSMATKLNDASTEVLAVLYAPPALEAALASATARFADLLGRWGGAGETAHAVIAG